MGKGLLEKGKTSRKLQASQGEARGGGVMAKITEEYIDKKARQVWNLWWYKASGKYATDFTGTIRFDFQGVKNLIRNLLEYMGIEVK